MKLLFLVADEYPTHRPDVTVLFGRELPRRGVSSDLVGQLAVGERPDVHLWPPGKALLCTRTGSRVRDQLAALAHDLRSLRSARRGQYDAIQVRDKVFAGLAGLLRARRLGLPFAFWMSFPMSEGFIEVARHGARTLGPMRWMFLVAKGHVGKWLVYRVLLPRCDHVFAQSEVMAANLVRHGVRADRITAVPMGVDLDELPKDSESGAVRPREEGGPLLAYLGALDRARGLEFLLDVLVHVRRSVPGARLLFVGDASEEFDRAWLMRRADELGVADAVTWTGWLARPDAWRRVREADVAVSLVPRGELFDCSSPTKVVEYLALGLPVVANDSPDQYAVLSESGAGIPVPTQVEPFAAAVVKILRDPELGARMRRAGPPYVRERRSYAVLADLVAASYGRLARPASHAGGNGGSPS